jgi:hypothetical protein
MDTNTSGRRFDLTFAAKDEGASVTIAKMESNLKSLQATMDETSRHAVAMKEAAFGGGGGGGAGRGGGSGHGGGGGLADEFRGIHHEARSFRRMVELGGAIPVADMAAEHLNKLGEGADKFFENIRAGMSPGEAARTMLGEIPGAGPLGKAGRSFWDKAGGLMQALNIAPGGQMLGMSKVLQQMGEEAAEEEKEQKKKLVEQMEKRNKKREPIIRAVEEMDEETKVKRGMIGKEGFAREIAQAEAEYDREARKIKEARDKLGILGPEEEEKATKALNERATLIEEEKNDKIREINKKWQELFERDQEKHEDAMSKLRGEARTEDLQRLGLYYTAKREAVMRASDDEQRAIEKDRIEQLRDKNRDPLAVRMRTTFEMLATRNAEIAKLDTEKQRHDEEQQDAERDFAKRTGDLEDRLQERRLRMFGRGLEADKLGNLAKERDALFSIEKDREDQLRRHGEDAPAINRRAEMMAQLAEQDYGLSDAEILQRRAEMFKPEHAADVRGDVKLLTGLGGNNPAVAEQSQLAKDQLEQLKRANGINDKLLTEIKNLRADIKKGSATTIPAP